MNVILIGFGVVGQNVAKMLSSRSHELRKLFGVHPNLVAIVDRGGTAFSEDGIDLIKAIQSKRAKGTVSALHGVGKPGFSALEVLEKVDGDVVIEVTPTNIKTGEPGLTHILSALTSGRHVITTNKGPLALDLINLLELSRKNNVILKFSGAVGGGMPILDFAKNSLHGERILSIRGVLNGTTNYILWKMVEERLRLEEALVEAQKLGYAEKEASYDLDGIDTACKLVILANWIMDYKVSIRDVRINGISDISLQDVLNAEKENSAIRLVGSINKDIKVRPEKIPKKDLLCVDSNYNAVTFTSAFTGQHTLIGRGAGGQVTAGSVIRDIINITQKQYPRTLNMHAHAVMDRPKSSARRG
jgi:homoserine dehydrogenase